MPKKALLLGSYGQTNLGDDLLMYNILLLLQQQGYTKVTVNITDKTLLPNEVMEKFGSMIDLHETYTTSALSWLKILMSVDTVIYGGGTIFKDLYSSTGRSKHAVVMRIAIVNVLARMLGKEVIHLFIGIGSIRTKTGAWLTRLSLNSAAHSYFRDKESYEYAKKLLHVSDKKISLSTDGIFLNFAWGSEKALINVPEKYDAIVGINVLSDIPDWINRDQYITELKQLVTELEKRNYFIVFVPFQTKFNPLSDLVFIEKEIAAHLDPSAYLLYDDISLSKLKSLFGQLDLFVGMRFHSLLSSVIFKTPFVGIEYDTKCTRLMQDMSYPYSVPIEGFTAAKVLEQVDELKNADMHALLLKQQAYINVQQLSLDGVRKALSE
jgi:polysaccharide pyruvyl transferase WcaK-like protein